MKLLSLVIPLIASLLLAPSCVKLPKDSALNGLSRSNLRGSVKVLTTRTYFAVDSFGLISNGDPAAVDNTVEYFDENGNKTERSLYDIDGRLREKWLWLYDEASNVKEERKVFGVDLNLKLGVSEKGREPRPLDISWQHTYAYDSNGRIGFSLILYRNKSEDPKVVDSSVYDYYSNGRLRNVRSYLHPSDDAWSTAVGDVTVRDFSIDGLLTHSFECSEIHKEFGVGKVGTPPGRLSKTQFERLGVAPRSVRGKFIRYDTTQETSYEYENGLLIQKISVSKYPPETVVTTHYEYNANGHLLKENVLGGSSPHVYTFAYEYDYLGNWISKVTYENGVPAYVFRREIEYY
jgi:hypothetical protein